MATTFSGTGPAAGHAAHSRTAEYLALPAFVFGCHAAGFLGTLAGNRNFYQELTQPSWAPPASLFAPAWLVLYTLMGVAGWFIWRLPPSRERKVALTMFAVQLVLNAMWTPLFFGLERIGLAFGEIFVTTFVIGATTVLFWKLSRTASLLFVPYLSWVSYATVLNYALWRLNS